MVVCVWKCCYRQCWSWHSCWLVPGPAPVSRERLWALAARGRSRRSGGARAAPTRTVLPLQQLQQLQQLQHDSDAGPGPGRDGKQIQWSEWGSEEREVQIVTLYPPWLVLHQHTSTAQTGYRTARKYNVYWKCGKLRRNRKWFRLFAPRVRGTCDIHR